MNSGWPTQRFTEARCSTSRDDRGVEADAGVEAEVAAVDHARARPGGCRRASSAVGEHARPRRRDRWAGRACGRTRWSSRRAAPPSAVSVPASPLATSLSVPSPPNADDHVDAPAAPRPGRSGWRGRGGWSRRLDVVLLRQRLVHDHRVAGGDRRGERVDDEQDAHEAVRRYARSAPVRDRRRSAADRLARLVTASVTMAGHERRRLREADPRPGRRRARWIPATNTLKRDGKLILDESDSYGVEMALQLVDAAGGGEVSLVSMAPNGEVVGPAHGAGHGRGQGRARLATRRSPGSDALTTAKVLAAAIERLGGADLVIAGHRVDRRLHRHRARADRRAARPAVGHLRQARRGRRRHRSRSQRQTEAGYDEVDLPAARPSSRVTAGVVEPRYPSFKGIMAAKSKPVDTVTAADLGVDAGRLGRRRPGDRRTSTAAEARAGRRDHRGRRRGLRSRSWPSSRT